ncbi:MAG TPA: NAD-dependent epimerase/dehydratase family protein [Burkholderiales bacterium]|nr:NAD-dependent epimerase/dehydratase family protein [Burkholderiales bacterium]
MKVLVLGGTGFIGRHAAAALRARGHAVLIGTRSPKRALAKLPPALRDCDLRETHLESLTTCYVWKPLLADVDAVVNAVGILRERGGETYDRVHHMAPRALAVACERMEVRLVHISALGLRPEARSSCLRSKWLGERRIAESFADYSIVRPSLLDGDGGFVAAWLRRAAQWPVHFYPADARGQVAALDVRDLGDAVAALCEARRQEGLREVELGGSARRTMVEHLGALRAVQGGKFSDHPALRVAVPAPLAWLAGLACDFLHFTPVSSANLELMRRDNLPRENILQALIGRAPAPVGRNPAPRPAYAFTAMPTGHETPVPPSPQ